MSEKYYLQDKRGYVGNDLLFWAEGGKGYTTDTSKAHVYTKEEAFTQNRCRDTDIPWPKKYIDARTRPVIDHQYVDIDIALKDSGEKLQPPWKQPQQIHKCQTCGKFISEHDSYTSCPHCGEGQYH
jgi:rubrerythrin